MLISSGPVSCQMICIVGRGLFRKRPIYLVKNKVVKKVSGIRIESLNNVSLIFMKSHNKIETNLQQHAPFLFCFKSANLPN